MALTGNHRFLAETDLGRTPVSPFPPSGLEEPLFKRQSPPLTQGPVPQALAWVFLGAHWRWVTRPYSGQVFSKCRSPGHGIIWWPAWSVRVSHVSYQFSSLTRNMAQSPEWFARTKILLLARSVVPSCCPGSSLPSGTSVGRPQQLGPQSCKFAHRSMCRRSST